VRTKLGYCSGALRASKAICIAVITAVASLFPASSAVAGSRSPCDFTDGFKTLHDLTPAVVGDCVNNQSYAANGDARQLTTRGMLVWRKVDNWTAFTDGYQTWLNGPNGIAQRLNSQRFPWESQVRLDGPYAGMTADFFAMLNADRKQAGLPPLTLNPLLTTLAQSRTQEILESGGALNHYAADGKLAVGDMLNSRGAAYRVVGENLAEDTSGPDQSVTRTNGALMGSAPHRANILNPAYTQAGVAIASRGPGGPFFYVQVFSDLAG
jgi:uncharacterized protein YkwD